MRKILETYQAGKKYLKLKAEMRLWKSKVDYYNELICNGSAKPYEIMIYIDNVAFYNKKLNEAKEELLK